MGHFSLAGPWVAPMSRQSHILPSMRREERGFSVGRRIHHDGAIMIVIGLLGILTGGAMVALAANSFQADAAGVMGPGSTAGILILLGLGLVGVGIRDRRKNFQGTPIDGRYLVLGMREVNLRGASLFQRTRGKEGEHENRHRKGGEHED